ncbi:alkane 1-monooxygenase [Brevirhabdus sp.]|uniref:alkane 1-monooxygenase n=1 Tax=Brevirhabdus sp. TaxID=2004514 RepID=UPI004059B72B
MGGTIAGFALASGLPLGLLLAAGHWGGAPGGGALVWLALASVTVVVAGIDGLLPGVRARRPSDRGAQALSVALALAHFVLLWQTIAALVHGSALGGGEKLGLFVAAGLFFGQVSNSNAHELIHRPSRLLRRLGAAVYTSLLFGHHASAHPAVHHRHVATPDDPNTSRRGESFYRFAPRAWRGSFRAGLRVENARLARKGRGALSPANPYWGYTLGGMGLLAVTGTFWGVWGVLLHVALAAHATMQLLLSDYVQHYGLMRQPRGTGGYEPVGPQHSWNAPHWYSALMMLNAPRHSDHHAHPSKAFPALTLPDGQTAPQLPHSLPVIATMALFPRLFRRVMHPRLRAWTARAPQDAA